MANLDSETLGILDKFDSRKPVEFDADVQSILNLYDSHPAYAARTKEAPIYTPNDISGEGRDEYGRPLAPLAVASPAEVSDMTWNREPVTISNGQRVRPLPFENEARAYLQEDPTVKSDSGLIGYRDLPNGGTEIALPNQLRSLGRGVLDLLHGPETGTVTPEATGALAGGMMGGTLGRSPANIPGRFAVLPSGAAAVTDAMAEAQRTGVATPASRSGFSAVNGDSLGGPGWAQTDPRIVARVNDVAAGRPSAGALGAEVGPGGAEATGDGGARSVGAAASRDMSPPGTFEMTPGEARANRAMAEREWLTTQGTPAPFVERVPNVKPSLATLEQRANLAREEKMIESQLPEPWKEAAAANGQARKDLFEKVAGSAPQVQGSRANSGAVYEAGIEKAFKNKNSVPDQDVVDLHDKIVNDVLNHPFNIDNPTLQQYLGPLVGKLVNADGSAAITDPERLMGLRRQAGRLMDKMSSGPGGDANLRHITHELDQFQDALTPVIEKGAPGISNVISDYAESQRVPDIQEALQNYETGKNGHRSIYDSQGRMTYSGVHGMLGDIIEGRANSDPLNPFKHMTDEQFETLKNIHDSLKAVASAKELARAHGSDTAQNAMDVAKQIGTNSIIGIAAHKIPLAGPVIHAINDRNRIRRIQQRSNELLNPPTPPPGTEP